MVNLDLPSFLHFLHAVAHKKDRIPSISHMWSGMVTYPVLVTQSLGAILWAKLKFNLCTTSQAHLAYDRTGVRRIHLS